MTDEIKSTSQPKVRKLRPPWTLKPGSRAAWGRGCRCSYITMQMHQSGEHGEDCPVSKWKAEFERQDERQEREKDVARHDDDTGALSRRS